MNNFYAHLCKIKGIALWLLCVLLVSCAPTHEINSDKTATPISKSISQELTITNYPTKRPTFTSTNTPGRTAAISSIQSPSLTPDITPTLKPPSIPTAYTLPAWLANPDYSVLAMITDVSETANQLTFLNAGTHERIDISIPNADISRYFWTPDGKGLGFLLSDFLSVQIIDITNGKVKKYDVNEQATQCLSEHDKEKRLIVRPIRVYSSFPSDLSFFCPTDASKYKAYRGNKNGEPIIFLENLETGKVRELTQINDGLDDLSFTWSPASLQIAVLQGPTPDPDDRSPMGTRILIYDMMNGNVVMSYEGHYCSLNWSPDGKKLLTTETSSIRCYSDAQPDILYPNYGQKKLITAIEKAHHASYLDLFEWSKDSNSLLYVYINSERSDICIYDLQDNSVFCPTEGVKELAVYNVEHYKLSPNGQFIVFSYGDSCSGCDFWGEPSSAFIGIDGNNFYPIAKEIFRSDIEAIDYPYPYGTMLWRPIPVP